MRKLTTILLSLTTILTYVSARSVESIIDPYTIDSTRYVSDESNYLKETEIRTLDSICAKFNHEINMEVGIVIVDEIDQTPFDFALALYNRWELGRDDRGLLLLVVGKQHRWQFITGHGAEGVFPDGLLSMVGRGKLVPYFKTQDYYGGIKEALLKLYNIASDEEYDRNQFSFSDNPKSNYSPSEIWLDWCYSLYALIAFVVGICASVIADNGCSIKSDSSIRPRIIGKTNATIIINSSKKINGMGVWANHGYLRYFLIDIPFAFIIWFVSLDKTDSFGWFVLGLLIYMGYKALMYAIALLVQAHKKNVTDTERYVAYSILSKSTTMHCYKLVAPYIAFPFYWYLNSKISQYRKGTIKCPVCYGDITDNIVTEIKGDLFSKFETQKSIIDRLTYTCTNGHKVSLGLPGSNFDKYHHCNNCDARTMEQINTKTIRTATTLKKGLSKITYRCKFCKRTETENIYTPKISSSWSGGSYSGGSSYGGGSSYSGGSRGGGYSGGGGAGGGW